MRAPHRMTLLACAVLLWACEGNEPSNAAPTALFAVQCQSLACTFTDGSSDADGDVESYVWDFGDNSEPVTTRDAAHTYTAAGRFTVELTVTDDDGATATRSAPVDVTAPNGPPTASFTVSCPLLTCSFTDRSFDGDAGGRVVAWSWDFGDGSLPGTTRDPRHTYLRPGQFTVTLTVRDEDGETATTIGQATPNAAPTASFTYSCTDLTCAFANRSSDPGGTLVHHSWRFGDGTSSEVSPEHTFQAPAVYQVMLTVTDDRGISDSLSALILVPAPDFTVACLALECTFTAQDFGFGGSRIWQFGDGVSSTDPNPTHLYHVTEPTAYTVTLIVWDDFSFEGYANSHDITVSP